MEMSSEIKDLALALSKAQGAIGNVEKNRKGHGYKYADLGQCIDAIKEALSKNEIAIVQPIDVIDGQNYLVTTLMHSSGQWIKSKFALESAVMKMCNNLQNLGAGLTYARRYALCAMIGLAQDDDDAQSLTKNQEQQAKVVEIENRTALANTLMTKCKENGVDTKAFATHFSISSDYIESLKNALSNFDTLLAEYKSLKAEEVSNVA
jgi:hypothetical protein